MKPLFGLLKSGTSYLFKKQLFLTNVGISFGLSGKFLKYEIMIDSYFSTSKHEKCI
jgi:hypothetical protein